MAASKLSSFASMDFDSEYTQTWTTLSLCFLLVVIGVPIWWKTTEVYRADLPYNQIHYLHDQQTLYLKVNIKLGTLNKDLDISPYPQDLAVLLNKRNGGSAVSFLYNVEEIIETADESATNSASNDVIRVLFDSKDIKDFQINVTKGRLVYCYASPDVTRDHDTVMKMLGVLTDVIKNTLIGEGILSEMVSNNYGTRTQYTHDESLKKIIQSNPQFELLFSLLCPEPEKVLPKWHIEQAMKMYFGPMLDKISPVFGFNTSSQILYYTKIFYTPKLMNDKDENKSFYYLKHNELSHVINPIESKIGSHVTSDPTLNFAVYVTEQKHTPLHIIKENGMVSKSNSFLIPRWGAMVFYNLPKVSNEDNQNEVYVSPKVFMEPFKAHFRTLLGVQPHHNSTSASHKVAYDPPGIDGLTDWELDHLMRLRTSENLASSVHTLYSLSKLLSKIKNIVINDNIADEVLTAVKSVASAKTYLKNGSLTEALRLSRVAFTAAETAFFDPTLLELLYFPEDQKFAIYVPFFLPISLPLLVAVIRVIKRLKTSKKEKSD